MFPKPNCLLKDVMGCQGCALEEVILSCSIVIYVSNGNLIRAICASQFLLDNCLGNWIHFFLSTTHWLQTTKPTKRNDSRIVHMTSDDLFKLRLPNCYHFSDSIERITDAWGKKLELGNGLFKSFFGNCSTLSMPLLPYIVLPISSGLEEWLHVFLQKERAIS